MAKKNFYSQLSQKFFFNDDTLNTDTFEYIVN